MKNLRRLTAVFLLVVSIVITALPMAAEVSAATLVYSTESNSGTRHVVCTTLEGTSAGSYYTGENTYDNLSELSANELFDALQTLMRDTHTRTSKYSECRDMAVKTDCENNDGRINLIYCSKSVTRNDYNGGNNWNREHVWPKSLGGKNDNDHTGGADLHHIRPSDSRLNSTRNNNLYGNVNGGKAAMGGTLAGNSFVGGYVGGGYFEPLDNVKGDVARICLYVYVRWNSQWGANSITQVFQSVDVLLEWCELDPVDTWEMGRNEVIAAYQGNRNVFIDYPEYAWLLFGEEVPEGMTTPSGEAASGGSSTVDPTCKHTRTEVRNPSDATCGKDGYTGDTHCKDCEKKLVTGTKINATGNHSFGEWTVSGGKETRTCSVCKKVETKACTHKSTEIKNASDATCGKDGYTGDTFCKDCGAKLLSGSKINATGNHSFGEWETKDNSQSRTCSVCSKTESRPLPQCEHKNTEVKNAISPTCGEEGYTGDTCCKDCGTKLSGGETVAATGDHKKTEYRGGVAPTCGKKGSTGDLYCIDCENKIADSEKLAATGDHKNTELRSQKDATCGKDGYTGDTYCKDCEQKISSGSVISATGKHEFEDVETISEPTRTEDGMKLEACKNCGFTQATVIPATGDNTVLIIAIVAGAVLAAAVVVVVIIAVNKKKKAK